MNPAMKKNSSSRSGSDIPSPVLLRRRLSAPETVMRKYKLARARSQESDTDHSSDSKFGELSFDSHSGSEMNLQKKKDTAIMMRKSTLLRRLMNNPKAFGSSSFQEWQHYCGKLSTPSLTSLQGSPEHMSKSYSRRSLVGYEYKTSPKHNLGSKKVSPVHQLYETHKKSPVHLASMSPKRRLDNHGVSYQIHSTKPKEAPALSSVRSSVNDLSKSTFAQSDSAYSNDRSNISPYSASTCTSNTNLTTQESIRYKLGPLENNPENMDQRNVDENRNFSVNTNVNYVTQETSTQTTSTTNLNVISNVKLSQKTLDMIVSEVMKDVQNKGCANGNDVQDKTAGSIHVRKISGLNEISSGNIQRPNETLKYLTDARLQAHGHNSSRISIISSKSSIGDRSDIIEDHSDVASIADSLEDTSSSRLSLKKYDDKPVRGDLPPIPVRGRKKVFNTKPPDAFFVPIKTEAEEVKSVSDYLPEKLREKILRRQKNRQEKVDQYRNNLDLSTMYDENANGSKSRSLKNKVRYRKPLLPSIESIRKKQKDEQIDEQKERTNTKKSKRKSRENPPPTSRKSKSTRNHHNPRHFHLFTSENDYLYEGEPKRIVHKAEFRNSNRRIEILEIMECVDLGARYNKITTRTKSKIPLLKSPKLTKMTTNPVLVKKATYLDFSEVFKADPNLDELISDILIQSLDNNKEVSVETKTKTSKNENDNSEQRGDVKDELTAKPSNDNNDPLIANVPCTNDSGIQVSEVDLNERNNIKSNQVPTVEPGIFKSIHKEIQTINDSKNTQTISEDWVEYRMPQKKEEPSFIDHASNEGRNPVNPKVEIKDKKFDEAKEFNSSSEEWRRYRTMQEEYEFESSSNDKNDFYKRIILPPPLPKRYGHSSRRPRYRDISNGNPTPGEWSIILSGTNNATLASDLEMKIRFPSSRRNSCFPFNNNSELRESRANTGVSNEGTRFPQKHFNNFDNANRFYNENNERFRKLPDINNMRVPDNQRVSDPVAALRAMEINDIRPRQTKTSLRRYNMTRPKLHPLFETNIDNPDIDSQYTGMLKPVPDILSINGYSVSPDNKYNVPGMSRRNIPRHSCINTDI